MLNHIRESGRRYIALEDGNARRLAENDPALFFETYGSPLLIGEFQRVPSILLEIKRIVDEKALKGEGNNGMFWLTGSQKFKMMQNVSESLAGRVAVDKVVYESDGTQATDAAAFTNVYTPAATEYQPQVEKRLTGAPAPADETFTFALSEVSDPNGGAALPEEATVSIEGEGTAQFGANGYTYDASNWTLTVNVEDVSGRLQVRSAEYVQDETGAEGAAAVFVNDYQVKPASYAPKVVKTVEGDVPEDAVFTFQIEGVRPQEGAALPENAQVQITGGGEAAFDAITFTRAGTYTFTIWEADGGVAGYTYDETAYTLTVTVEDVDSQLTVTGHSYASASGETSQAHAAFTNVYAPAETAYIPKVRKALTGQAAPEAATFAFTLMANPENPDGAVIGSAEASVTGAGEAAFGAIRFARRGTYAFTIAEVNGGRTGYTYDGHTWTLQVAVADDGGALRVESAVYTRDDGAQADAAEFANHYEPLPTTVEILGEKRVDGTPQAQETFRFELTAQEAGSPMPEGSAENAATVAVTGAGAFSFGEMRFTVPGTYTYTVRELPGDALGYTYDGSVYAVTVEITDVDGALAAQVRYEKGEEAGERALFVNRYETGDLTVAKTVKGDGADRNRAFAFEVTLFDANGAPLAGTYPCTRADGSAAGAMENGRMTFNLAHGQSLTIHDLPVGATYRVVETEHRGYTPSCASSEGSIVSGEAHVDYINTRNQSTDIPKTGYGEDLGRYALLAVCLATALLAGIGRKMLKPARRKGRH